MMRYGTVLASVLALLSLSACQSPRSGEEAGDSPSAEASSPGEQEESSAESSQGSARANKGNDPKIEALDSPPEELAQATFAGGCFWCMEPPFDNVEGVEQTIVGYSGGQQKHPTYKEVAGGRTDHAESIRIYYDPDEVSYAKLLNVFWRHIDPTAENRQFVDVGSQYRSIIFYHDDEQKQAARASKRDLAENGPFDESIATPIEEVQTFWKAEDYHQNFYKKSPDRYHSYHSNSGRKEFRQTYWADSDWTWEPNN